MNHLYKSIISFVLAFATLLPICGCNRKKMEYLNTDCYVQFMKSISELDYESAFSQLSSKCTTMPADNLGVSELDNTSAQAPTESPAQFITRTDFVKKYYSIFSGLGISSVEYSNVVVTPVNSERKTVYYTANYTTSEYGVLSNSYEMNLIVEDGSWYVDWDPSLIFPDMTWGSTVRIVPIAAKRGDILADGKLLARTIDLNAIVADVEKIDDLSDFSTEIGNLISKNPLDIIEAITKSESKSVIIAQLNEIELTPDIHEALDNIDGITILGNYGTYRYYPENELLAHTIGYVGYVGEDELPTLNQGRTEADGLYTTHSIVGRSGIERSYETTLRGKDGINIVIRDASGKTVSTIYSKPVQNGSDVHLTIDLDLQKKAEKVMDLVLWGDNTAGSVVAMNPKTGEIKAMVSYPAYDLNKLAISADTEYYNRLADQANKPLQNRSTLGLYPPGSAFKVFTASAALEMNYVTSEHVFTGNIESDYWTPTNYGKWIWPPIKRTKINDRGLPLNMFNAMIHSDNIYFADLALMMGEEKFLTYLRGIGMEQSMPFELSVAKSTLKIKADSPTDWNLRSIAETGYGQGQVTISPLQLASMFCAFRNEGDMPTPILTKALYSDNDGEYKPYKTFESTPWIKNAIQKSTIETLEPMLEGIMSTEYNGTGYRLKARGCTVAGKTGTAEIGSDKKREISWFVGYRVNVAAEDELLVLVMLELPTEDEYKYIKFDIARELISTESAYPALTQAPSTEEPGNGE